MAVLRMGKTRLGSMHSNSVGTLIMQSGRARIQDLRMGTQTLTGMVMPIFWTMGLLGITQRD